MPHFSKAVLVTGGDGMLARAVAEVFDEVGWSVAAPGRHALDVRDAPAVREAIAELRPDVVVQCAAYTAVDDAESHEEDAFAVNAGGTRNVALACRAAGATLVYPGSDYVFDGRADSPYRPDDPPGPLNAYGRSKLAGEEAAAEAGRWLVLRTSWLYGAGGSSFVRAILERGRAGEPLEVVDDQRGAPTWTVDWARVLIRLLAADAESGVYHVTNRGDATWHDLASAALELAGLDVEPARAKSTSTERAATRPSYSVLDLAATLERVGEIPHWRDALREAIDRGL